MAESPAPGTPPWMILNRFTTIRPLLESGDEPDTFDLKLSYQTPPLRTGLAVRAAVCARRLHINSIDPTGNFILSTRAEEGMSEPEIYSCCAMTGEVIRLPLVARSLGDGAARSSQNLGTWDPQRFIAEVASLGNEEQRERVRDMNLRLKAQAAQRRAGVEVDLDGEPVIDEHLGVGENLIDDSLRVHNFGIVNGPHGNQVIVELRQARGAETGNTHARLLCFTPMHEHIEDDRWFEKVVTYPPNLRPWRGDGMICHQHKGWWFSLGYGLLTCDPFAESPILEYFPLPSGCEIAGAVNHDLSKTRCINVSAGTLWFVILEGAGEDTVIKSWRFTGSSDKPWTTEYELPCLEMWNDDGYNPMGLQRDTPEIVFVHPTVPELIYLQEGCQIFSVNLSLSSVESVGQLSNEELHPITSAQQRFFAWQLTWQPWLTMACATICDPRYKDDIVVARRQTPRPSFIAYGPDCLPKPPEYMYVAATDPSGKILLCGGYRRQGRTAVHKVYVLMDHEASNLPGRRICRLPDQNQEALRHGNVGLIVDSRSGNSYVAELVPEANGSGVVHLWTSTDVSKWTRKEVNHPLQKGFVWNGNGVVSWNSMLWWVDLSQGLMCYNILAVQPKVRFLPLPAGSEIGATLVKPSIVDCRLVKVSEGLLRYAELHGPIDAPIVTVWTVVVNKRNKLNWKHEYNLNLNEVWASSWFKGTELPSEMPILALIHPLDHQVLYFVQGKKMYSVDVRQPSVNMERASKFEILGSAGECRSGLVHSYVPPIETFVLVPKE